MERYRMAAYCRLSKEDHEKDVSESIENQLELIRRYAAERPDLQLEAVYADDGYSGLYFENRPGFCRMMKDIYQGKLQGVITKDISRLGRDHIETGNYLERVFPAYRIRFIAILDGVDTLYEKNDEMAQFKTLLNDLYSKDLSKKIRGSLNAQKKRGRYMSGFVPYGYRKDPSDKHHLLIDEQAAEIVRQIYDRFLAGCSLSEIADQLNRKRILTPSEYKRSVLGLHYQNPQEQDEEKRWGYSTVRSILKNRVYTGVLVQHKTEKISYKIRKCRYIPEEEWCCTEQAHEAVIGSDAFASAQEIFQKRRRMRSPLK